MSDLESLWSEMTDAQRQAKLREQRMKARGAERIDQLDNEDLIVRLDTKECPEGIEQRQGSNEIVGPWYPVDYNQYKRSQKSIPAGIQGDDKSHFNQVQDPQDSQWKPLVTSDNRFCTRIPPSQLKYSTQYSKEETDRTANLNLAQTLEVLKKAAASLRRSRDNSAGLLAKRGSKSIPGMSRILDSVKQIERNRGYQERKLGFAPDPETGCGPFEDEHTTWKNEVGTPRKPKLPVNVTKSERDSDSWERGLVSARDGNVYCASEDDKSLDRGKLTYHDLPELRKMKRDYPEKFPKYQGKPMTLGQAYSSSAFCAQLPSDRCEDQTPLEIPFGGTKTPNELCRSVRGKYGQGKMCVPKSIKAYDENTPYAKWYRKFQQKEEKIMGNPSYLKYGLDGSGPEKEKAARFVYKNLSDDYKRGLYKVSGGGSSDEDQVVKDFISSLYQ